MKLCKQAIFKYVTILQINIIKTNILQKKWVKGMNGQFAKEEV